MWPFSKSVTNLKDSGIFSGLTDWHSHILPGVDDGIQTIEDSLEVLDAYQKLGIKRVWLTPHIMEDYPNETAMLKDKFAELSERWNGTMEIKLAAENMLDSLYEDRLAKDDFLPIGDSGTHLLVETSYYTPPYGMDDMLDKTRRAGYFPVLAHPERYRYMEENDYKRLKDDGVLFQMNYISLVGGYGETARKKAEWLLSKGMIDVLGSDVHRLASVEHHILESPKKKEHLEKIMDVAKSVSALEENTD